MYTTSSVVSVLVIVLVAESCHGFEDALVGCDVPPQFWCSSDEVAQKCQVCVQMQFSLIMAMTTATDIYTWLYTWCGYTRGRVEHF